MLTINCRTIKIKAALIISLHTRPLTEDSSIKQKTYVGMATPVELLQSALSRFSGGYLWCYYSYLWKKKKFLCWPWRALSNYEIITTVTHLYFSPSQALTINVSDTNHQCFPSSHFLRKVPTRISSSSVNEEKCQKVRQILRYNHLYATLLILILPIMNWGFF